MASPTGPDRSGAKAANGFRHEAAFYAGADEFVRRMSSFVREGVGSGERVMVMVTLGKIELLRAELGRDAKDVDFEDMADVGRNPARIIPAWREFFASAAAIGRRARGVGEPIWAARTAAELTESQRHEELVNLAFAHVSGSLVCPYDTETLPPRVITEAMRSHPTVFTDGSPAPSDRYRTLAEFARPFAEALPEPPAGAEQMRFDLGSLEGLRAFVGGRASAFGLAGDRASGLVLAVSEAAANSLRHGGGRGALLLWTGEDTIVCEVRDSGRIADPLVGRVRPTSPEAGGFGLWLINQLCDLVQVRTFGSGSVVRMHMNR
jgi:anti-sigma regulatory factor (Ser/Thr protein kinase)